MSDFARFAIYYAPPPGPLADFAASWLGWDAEAGITRPHPDLPGLPRPVADLTETPRRYGLHATLKPPFRPALGCSSVTLETDLAALASRRAPVALDGLRLARLGGFLALLPVSESPALAALAADCVSSLDHHRAAPTEDELARRHGKALGPAEEANLIRWGYPYVMDQFRFHLTLTGRLPPEQAETVQAVLAPRLAPLLVRPFVIGDLCLFGEASDGRFHLLSRHPLTG